jgi:DNA adenine methylase
MDFEYTLSETGDGDLVYIDPPYVTTHGMNGFLKYNERIFSWADQIRLRDCVGDALLRGATAIVSNASHQSITELYTPLQPIIYEIGRSSIIAADATRRCRVTELLIVLGSGR